MICKTCGETMIGDGYKTALHCPSVEAWDVELDADPIRCAPLGMPSLRKSRKPSSGPI